MDILSLIVGIVLGAAFSPFWIKLFTVIKSLVQKIVDKLRKK